jgi:hypothetical protein
MTAVRRTPVLTIILVSYLTKILRGFDSRRLHLCCRFDNML